MSLLAAASKPKIKAPVLTIIGSPGAGKTTLGAMFPNSIMLRAEDGTAVFESWDADMQPTVLPQLARPRHDKEHGGVDQKSSPYSSTMDYLRALVTEDHDYQTLVIDSVTALHKLFEQEIAIRDGVKTAADASGGFHKGYKELASWHAEIIHACNVIRNKKNMAIIYLAHIGIEKVKNSPSEASEYAIYSLDMHRDSAALYTAESDGVYYISRDEMVVGAEKDKKGNQTKSGRVIQSEERKLITSGDGLTGFVSAKDRYNVPNELEIPERTNPILQYIPFYNQTKTEV